MSTKNRNKFFASLAFVIIASLVVGSIPAQAGGPPPLFAQAADLPPGLSLADPGHVVRSRFVTVDMSVLFDANGRPRNRKTLPEISLDLFEDARFTGVVTRVKKDAWGASWGGRLKGHPLGYFYLTVTDGVFMAHIATPEGIYEVKWAADGLYKAVKIDQSRLGEDAPGEMAPPGPILEPGSLGPTADSGATIDVMVVYTTAAKNGEGGTSPMKALIKNAIALANTSYDDSGVTPDLRLVHVEEVSYTESGNLTTDSDRLTTTGDGFMDNVHSLRDIYGADMVGLITETAESGNCGKARAIMAATATAFMAVKRSCVTGNYSLAHEFGHLQGSRHDLYKDSSDIPYAYGHGYVHKHATDTTRRWRTVMAYNDDCSRSGYNCTRLNFWSNPTKKPPYKVDYAGVTGDSENYKVLNTTAYTVANFRTAVISTDYFKSEFNGSSAGWSAAAGAWALGSGMYYQSNGLANTGASARHTGIYGDMTYEVRMYRSGSCTACANRVIFRGGTALISTNRWLLSYEFAYNNAGQFSVWKVNSGSITQLIGWTNSSAIVKNGWNTLKVVAVGRSMTFYINNTQVAIVSDNTFATGSVGFGFYRDANAGTLYVNWAHMDLTPTADIKQDAPINWSVEDASGNSDRAP